MGAVDEQAGPELRLRVRLVVAGAIGCEGLARQHGPALDQDQLRRHGDERGDVRQASSRQGRQGLEIRPGQRPERHGQDVEPAGFDQRQQQPQRALELGQPDLGRAVRRQGVVDPDLRLA